MSAPWFDLDVERGASWLLPITWSNPDGTPVNLTGYTAKIEIRSGVVGSPGTVTLTLSTGNGKIVLGGPAGTILASLTATDTLTLTAGATLCYDLRLMGGAGSEFPLLRGAVLVTERVTVTP